MTSIVEEATEAVATGGASIMAHVWAYGAMLGIGLLSGGAAIGYLVWEIRGAQIAELKLNDANYAKMQTELLLKVQKAEDALALAAAVDEAKGQARIVHEHDTVTKEIPIYVQDTAHCITYGLVRLLHGAATGTDPAADTYTAGQPDGACAPLSWTSLATDYADDLATGRSNAEQLNAIIAYDTKADAAEAPPPEKKPNWFERNF